MLQRILFSVKRMKKNNIYSDKMMSEFFNQWSNVMLPPQIHCIQPMTSFRIKNQENCLIRVTLGDHFIRQPSKNHAEKSFAFHILKDFNRDDCWHIRKPHPNQHMGEWNRIHIIDKGHWLLFFYKLDQNNNKSGNDWFCVVCECQLQ